MAGEWTRATRRLDPTCRRLSRRTVAPLLLTVLAWGCGGGAGDPTDVEDDPCLAAAVAYPDPVQGGDTRHVHDPEIAVEGGFYYVFSTNDGIPIRRSSDLRTWSRLGRVFPNQLPSWAAGSIPGVEAPWAPGIAHFNGRYHLYYSLSTFGSPRSAIGLATNVTLDPASPQYAWQDRGKVTESFSTSGYNAIDPAVIEDVAGGLWLAWGSWWSGIKLRALDRATGMLSSEDLTTYSLASRPVEQALEAAFMIRRGPYYYLFVSFDRCCQGAESTYNVRVGRSPNVTGPYLDQAGVSLLQGGGSPVLTGYGRIRGPGHASVLPLGGEYLLVHHYYDSADAGTPHLQVRPLVWDADGWPLAGEEYEGTPPGPPPAGTLPTGRWGYWAGAGAAREIQLLAGGRAVACHGNGQWSYAPPGLTVQWGSEAGGATDRAVLSASGRSLVGRRSDGLIVRGYRRD